MLFSFFVYTFVPQCIILILVTPRNILGRYSFIGAHDMTSNNYIQTKEKKDDKRAVQTCG